MRYLLVANLTALSAAQGTPFPIYLQGIVHSSIGQSTGPKSYCMCMGKYKWFGTGSSKTVLHIKSVSDSGGDGGDVVVMLFFLSNKKERSLKPCTNLMH